MKTQLEIANRSKLSAIGMVALLLTVAVIVPLASTVVLAGKGSKPGKDPPQPADPAIALVKQRDMRLLEVMNVDGSNRATLHRSRSGSVSDPSWSPDGTSIAFEKKWIASFYGQIWAIDVQVVDGKPVGSNLRLILDGCYTCDPAWSPLGDEIAFAGEPRPTGEASEISVVSVDGGDPDILYQAPEGTGVRDPTWSADGSQIAFVEMVLMSGPQSIKIIDRETGAVTATLVEGEFRGLCALDWARTDDVIAFMGFRPGESYWIYTIDVTSGDVTAVV